LQALDQAGRVIYVGTFSKVLFPGLRVGYVVAPDQLLPALRSAKWLDDWCTSTFAQHVLADFLSEGHFDRHLRRARSRYAARRAALREALDSVLGDQVQVAAVDSGLHLVAWFPDLSPSAVNDLVGEARRHDVGVYPIAPYYLSAERARAGLLLGYTLIEERAIREGVRGLGAALERVHKARRAPRR
jgi:GntR family transcriptional regulator/MocR family aminotransferase